MSDALTMTLNNNVQIPQLGFGVFQVPPQDAERVVSIALETGYRSIGTAAAYHNEEGVGRALASSGLPRDEIFVTKKLWISDHGYDQALRAFDASVGRLGLETVDLYLVHWPVPRRRPVRRNLEGIGEAGRGRPGVSDRSIQLHRRAPATAARRDRYGARRQSN